MLVKKSNRSGFFLPLFQEQDGGGLPCSVILINEMACRFVDEFAPGACRVSGDLPYAQVRILPAAYTR